MSFSDNSSLFLLFLLFGPIPAFNLLRLLHCEIISCMMYHRGKASCSVHLLLIGGVSANSCWRRFLVRHQSIKLMIRRCQTLHRTLSVSVSPCVCVCVLSSRKDRQCLIRDQFFSQYYQPLVLMLLPRWKPIRL